MRAMSMHKRLTKRFEREPSLKLINKKQNSVTKENNGDLSGEMEIVEEVDNKAEDMIVLGLMNPEFIVQRKSCIVYPNDPWFMYWDMWISLVLLISCLITPVNFAF